MKVLRAMGIEEVVKFLNGDPLINRTRHPKASTDSVGFCFASGKDIHDVMQHLVGVVDDSVVLVGELKATPKHTFKKGWGYYSTHKDIPTTLSETMMQTLEMLAELVDKDKREEGRFKADEWSVQRYGKEDFDGWELYVRQRPTDKVLTKLGYNDFQKDIVKDLNSAQWLEPKLIAKGE